MATKLTGSICLTDIPAEYIQVGSNGKKYLNIEISEKKEIDQYGYSHYITVDTYKDGKRADQKYYLGNLKTKTFGEKKQDEVIHVSGIPTIEDLPW